jgi:hypothetical protein
MNSQIEREHDELEKDEEDAINRGDVEAARSARSALRDLERDVAAEERWRDEGQEQGWL